MLNSVIIDGYLNDDEKKSLSNISDVRNTRGKILAYILNSRIESEYKRVKIKSSIIELLNSKYDSGSVENMMNILDFFESLDDKNYTNGKKIVDKLLTTLSDRYWKNPNLKWFNPNNNYGIVTINIYHRLMIGLSDVICDENERKKHIIENMLYFVSDIDIKLFITLCSIDIYDDYKFNIYSGDIMSKDFDDYKNNVWGIRKFDVCVFNPIFKSSKYIKYIDKVSTISKVFSCLSLSGWIMNKKKGFTDLISRIQYMYLINGNALFDSEFGSPICVLRIGEQKYERPIIKYDTTGNTYKVDSIPSGFYEPVEIVKTLKSKFEELTRYENLGDLLNSKTTKYIVSAPRICGHTVLKANKNRFFRKDFYILFYRNSNLNNTNTKNKVYCVSSEEERNNLIEYMKSKIARFGLMLNKTSQDSHTLNYLKNIPLPDLSRKYTDKELCEKYNITEDEWNYIDEIIEDYY